MPFCPECGGEMKYLSATKRLACKSCGLSLTRQELFELRQQLRPKLESDDENAINNEENTSNGGLVRKNSEALT